MKQTVSSKNGSLEMTMGISKQYYQISSYTMFLLISYIFTISIAEHETGHCVAIEKRLLITL